MRTGDGASGEDAVTITFVGSFDGKWNDIHDIGYNRKTGAFVWPLSPLSRLALS